MSGIKDQSKLTKGKGFKNVKPQGNFFTFPAEVISSTLTKPITHLKNTIINRKFKKRGGKA